MSDGFDRGDRHDAAYPTRGGFLVALVAAGIGAMGLGVILTWLVIQYV